MKKNRKQILRYCILEIRESISVLFFISIGGCVLCLVLDNWDMLKLISNPRNTLGVAEYLNNSFSWGFYGIFVFAAMAAVAYGLGYYRDYKAGIILNVVAKTSLNGYCFGKLTAVFCSSFCAAFLSIGLFSAVLAQYLPLVSQEMLVSQADALCMALAKSGNYETYVILRCFMMALWCGVYGVVVICVSSIVKNAGMSIVLVIAVRYMINTLCNVLGIVAVYRPSSWFAMDNSAFSDAWTFVLCLGYVIIVTGVAGMIFKRNVTKKVQRG